VRHLQSLILILAILLLGLFFRLYSLSAESIWVDEAYSLQFANLNLPQIFYLQDTSPPLYYVILHWWIRVFGVSESSLRFPSVIFGVLSILMIYQLGKQLFDLEIGLICSLLLSFSVFHIEYSQEARTYSLSVLLTLSSMYFYIKALKTMNYIILTGYLVVSVLLIYSHIYGLFIIIAQNVYFIVSYLLSNRSDKPNRKRWLLVQSILLILFLPWLSIFANQVAAVQTQFWIKRPSISTLKNSFLRYSSGSRYLLLIFTVLSLFSLIPYDLTGRTKAGKLFSSASGMYPRKIYPLDASRYFFLLTWLIVPIIFPYIISLMSRPIYHFRYTIVASLPFYLLVAIGISKMMGKYIKIASVSVILMISLTCILGYYKEVGKEQWREVANYVDNHANIEDIILFNASFVQIPFNYYSHNDTLSKKRFPERGRHINSENIDELWPVVQPYKRVWVILSHSGDNTELLLTSLTKDFHLSRQENYKGIKLYLFDSPLAN
jgi:mannosyltransferase